MCGHGVQRLQMQLELSDVVTDPVDVIAINYGSDTTCGCHRSVKHW